MTTPQAQPVAPMKREDVERRAAEVLKRHGLFSIPVDPVTLANREGIKVNNAIFSDQSISGMVARRGNDVSFLINRDEPAFRKRFTVAHELGHHFLHLLGDGEIIDTKMDLFRESELREELSDEWRKEVQANQFAAALLMPAELLKRESTKTRDVTQLARLFNVSEQAMAIRLITLGLA